MVGLDPTPRVSAECASKMIIDRVRCDSGVTAWTGGTVPRWSEGLAEMIVDCSNHYTTNHISHQRHTSMPAPFTGCGIARIWCEEGHETKRK